MRAVVEHVLKLVPVLGRRVQAVDGRHVRVEFQLGDGRRRRRGAVAQPVADHGGRDVGATRRLGGPRDERGDVVMDAGRERHLLVRRRRRRRAGTLP